MFITTNIRHKSTRSCWPTGETFPLRNITRAQKLLRFSVPWPARDLQFPKYNFICSLSWKHLELKASRTFALPMKKAQNKFCFLTSYDNSVTFSLIYIAIKGSLETNVHIARRYLLAFCFCATDSQISQNWRKKLIYRSILSTFRVTTAFHDNNYAKANLAWFTSTYIKST